MKKNPGRSIVLKKQDETQFVSFFQASPDLMFVFTPEGKIIEVNNIALETLGYSMDELRGSSIFDLYQPERKAELDSVIKGLSGDKVVNISIPLVSKPGALVFVETRIGKGIWSEADIILSINKDVTERVRAEEAARMNEERYRFLFNKINDAVFVHEFTRDGLPGKFLEVNDIACERLGYTRDELLMMTPEGIDAPEGWELVPEVMRKLINDKHAVWEGIHMTKDGKRIPVEISNHLFEMEGKQVILATVRDITERKAAEMLLRKQNEEYAALNEELKAARDKARESDRLKSAFLANMSHEIRTPMNGIIGFSSILADNSLKKEDKEAYVKIVNSSCQQLLHIINDIIDISKIEAGQVDIEESPFIIRDLLDEVLSFFAPVANANGISLKLDPVPEQVAGIIESDRTKIRQVLDNLFSNALKFTPSGSITLKCSLENEFLLFRVSDTGIGIDPKVHQVIFERFRQADTNFSRTHEGTGLGLSISKAYVEKMGGAIGVDSETGKGASFWFTIPYKPARKLTVINDTHLKKSDEKRIFTVLVVEDEEINWLYSNEVLKDHFKVIRAKTGSEALELIKGKSSPDIILMDIKLPDINGLELTKMIRLLRKDLPVIALTAYALSGDREKAINAGCAGYLSKPVRREDLLDMVFAYCK